MKIIFAVLLLVNVANAESWNPVSSYRVPVGKDLEKYGNFQIPYRIQKNTLNEYSVKYDLPKELTGEQTIQINLKSQKIMPEGFMQMEGTNGNAVCIMFESSMECLIKYKNLQLNPPDIEKYLKGISKSDEEFQARKLVDFQFRSDPGGIIRYEMR